MTSFEWAFVGWWKVLFERVILWGKVWYKLSTLSLLHCLSFQWLRKEYLQMFLCSGHQWKYFFLTNSSEIVRVVDCNFNDGTMDKIYIHWMSMKYPALSEKTIPKILQLSIAHIRPHRNAPILTSEECIWSSRSCSWANQTTTTQVSRMDTMTVERKTSPQ